VAISATIGEEASPLPTQPDSMALNSSLLPRLNSWLAGMVLTSVLTPTRANIWPIACATWASLG